MKKLLGLFVVTSALFITAGCGNKIKNKAATQQQETVVERFVQEEQAASDNKEDYSIIA